MRERHDPDLEDQPDGGGTAADADGDDAPAEGDLAAGAATAGAAGQAAGIGTASIGGPALPTAGEEDDEEDERLR